MSHDTFQATVDTLIENFARFDSYPTPLVDVAVLIAQADGQIDPSELEMLRDVISLVFGARMRASLVATLVNVSIEVTEAAGIEGRLRLIAAILHDCESIEEGVRFAALVAHGSKGLGAPEKAMVARLGAACMLSSEEVARIIAHVQATVPPEPLSSKHSIPPGV